MLTPTTMPMSQSAAGVAHEIHTGTILSSRQRILEAAKQRFARHGFEGTTLAGIARGANVPYARLLRHFPDKVSVLTAVFDQGWATINARLADMVLSAGTARDAALTMLAGMTRMLERDPELARLLLFESRRPHPDSGEIVISQGYRRFMQICTELTLRGQRDGSFATAYHPRLIASLLIGAAESLTRDRLLAEQDGEAAPYASAQIAMMFDMLVFSLKF